MFKNEDSFVLRYDTMLAAEQLVTFQRRLLSPSLG